MTSGYATTDAPRKRLNDLSSKEWVQETISVWTQKGLGKNHPHAAIERIHPAPFSFQDIGRVIAFFTKRGETVLDPFVGVGSTLKACALSERHGVGIELNARYAELAEQRLNIEVPAEQQLVTTQKILIGDARELVPTLVGLDASLVVTSPPYWNILRKVDHKTTQERLDHDLDQYYSDMPEDLGNIPQYDHFVEELAGCLEACKLAMAGRGHLCLVVSDFRHKSRYYMFHADIAAQLEQRGFTLKGIIVLHQAQKRVFPYGYPTAFVPNVHHQYILVLQRNDG